MKKAAMNLYQLENKTVDEQFLKGEHIFCDAVLPVENHLAGALKAGARIVVLLSTGKKYMGEVYGFEYQIRNKHAEGKVEITRYPKPA